MEREAIHSCLTGQVIVRERTEKEQAEIDALRLIEPIRQLSALQKLEQRVAELEAKAK